MVTLGQVEAALDDLARRAPELFSRSLLIGGWCALLYYRILDATKDPEFPAPVPDDAGRLQSNDIDFTNVWKADYFDALPEMVIEPANAPAYLQVAGIRVGFAQAPEAIHPGEAFQKSRKFRTRAGTKFAVLDPVRLYRGKLAMIQKGRGKANDAFHLIIASTYARFELAQVRKKYRANPTSFGQARVQRYEKELKDLAPELLRD